MKTERLVDVLRDGYNMAVDAVCDSHIIISIGGSRREMRLDVPLALQVNAARLALGVPVMTITDGERLDSAQLFF